MDFICAFGFSLCHDLKPPGAQPKGANLLIALSAEVNVLCLRGFYRLIIGFFQLLRVAMINSGPSSLIFSISRPSNQEPASAEKQIAKGGKWVKQVSVFRGLFCSVRPGQVSRSIFSVLFPKTLRVPQFQHQDLPGMKAGFHVFRVGVARFIFQTKGAWERFNHTNAIMVKPFLISKLSLATGAIEHIWLFELCLYENPSLIFFDCESHPVLFLFT